MLRSRALGFDRRHLGEVEGDFGVGDLGAVAFEDAERVAVLALVEDHAPPARRRVRTGASVGFEHLAQRVLPLALGKSLFGGAGRLSAAAPEVESVGVRAAAAAGEQRGGREQAGESARTTARRIGGMLFEGDGSRRAAHLAARDRVAANVERKETSWRSERH